jgi:thiosulfate/3-mercaptopyruvate sulfurtransferase
MEKIVVSSQEVAAADDDVRIVDVREAWEYEGIGHLHDAVSIPFDSFRSAGTGQAGMLPDPDRWADLLGGAGIGAETPIVAYDDTHGVFAARFVVTALLFGHRPVHLLDGDYSAWIQEHPSSNSRPEFADVTYPTPSLDDSFLVDADRVARAGTEADTILVDTRSPGEFEAGHIQGSINVDWIELVNDETRGLHPRNELLDRLTQRGVTPDKRVILYCNTARRISHTYIVLRYLGFEQVFFYEGSLTEWRAEDRPLVTG